MRNHAHTSLHTVRAAAITIADNRAVFVAVAACLVLLCAIYTTLIHQTIRSVAERQLLETEMSVLNSRIDELEFRYISMRNDVTIDRAYELGFNDVTETKFVSRRSLSSAARTGLVQ